MHPNAVMLATVLLGNLMLPSIWAQNGKEADASCFVNTEVKVTRRPIEIVLREDFCPNAPVVCQPSPQQGQS